MMSLPRPEMTKKHLLKSERGFTLIELLVTVVVIAALILTIYIGIVYAHKQTQQNYRHRVATLLASGELERQYFIYGRHAFFMPFASRDVIIEKNTTGRNLMGTMSLTVTEEVEFNGNQQYKYFKLISHVEWIDPDTNKRHTVNLREDFYKILGQA